MKESEPDLYSLDPRPGPKPAVERAAPWYRRLLDGERLWGSIEVFPPRYGFHKYRLTVLPPGIDATGRRLVRAWRGWPVWGTAQWLLSVVLLNTLLAPGAATIFALGLWAITGAVLFAMAAPFKAEVHTLSVVLIDGYFDENSASRYAVWKQLSRTLACADELLERGELSRVDHEVIWSQVYDRVG